MPHANKHLLSLSLFASLIYLTACQPKQPVSLVNDHTTGTITLLDSATLPKTVQYQTGGYGRPRQLHYIPLYYIGRVTDTIRLGRYPIPEIIQAIDDTTWRKTAMYSTQRPDSTNIKIIVDTTQTLPVIIRHYNYDTNEEMPEAAYYYPAFAVQIYNQSAAPVHIALFSSLMHTQQQVKDSHGNWITISDPIERTCGTGTQSKFIYPGEMAIAKIIRHNKGVKTECRLKFSVPHQPTVFSNTFMDQIDTTRIFKAIRESENTR